MNQTIDIGDESKFALTNIPNLDVKNQLQYEAVVNFRIMAKEREKLINETFDPIVKKNHSAWKQAIETRDKFLGPVTKVISLIDYNIRAFKLDQERKAQEEQDKLRHEAEEKALKEKAKLEVRAEKAEAKGDDWKAEELREKAQEVEVLVPTVAPTFHKIKGDTTRKTYRCEVVDIKLVPDEFKVPDMQALNALARAKKENFQIAGTKLVIE